MGNKTDELNDLAFDADQFFKWPVARRVQLCVDLANRAQALAKKAPPEHAEAYLRIATEWLRLAEEIGRAK